MQPPEIATPRLRLVAPSLEFATNVFDYSSDEEFCRHIDARPATSVGDCRDFLNHLARDNANGRRCYWVVVEQSSGCAIGTLGLLFTEEEPNFPCQAGYGIARTHWGTGEFQEALAAALSYGFSDLSLERIFVLTRRENIRAVRSVEKLGFQRAGSNDSYYQTSNGTESIALYLTRENSAEQLAAWTRAPVT